MLFGRKRGGLESHCKVKRYDRIDAFSDEGVTTIHIPVSVEYGLLGSYFQSRYEIRFNERTGRMTSSDFTTNFCHLLNREAKKQNYGFFD